MVLVPSDIKLNAFFGCFFTETSLDPRCRTMAIAETAVEGEWDRGRAMWETIREVKRGEEKRDERGKERRRGGSRKRATR